MKEYIVMKIKNDSLIFDYKRITIEQRSKVNKNVFYNNTLLYTKKYFEKNIEKISKMILSYYKIKWFMTNKLIPIYYIVDIMNNMEISYLKLVKKTTLSKEDYNKLLEIKKLKYISVYYMPDFIKKKFEDKNIKVKTNNEYKITDKFMLDHDAFDYDTLYYKKQIDVYEEYDELFKDIQECMRINQKLKAINIYTFSKDIIENIIKSVEEDEARNVLILLHQKNDKGNFIENNFEWLKEINKKCKDNLICEFRIIYSNNYVRNNLFKQLTLNNVKLILILGIYILSSMLIIEKSYTYVEKLNADKLKTDLMNDNIVSENEINNDIDIELPETEEITKEEIKSKYEFKNIMSNLKNINNETVGYLVVNNTNISYPVVQHSDNSYYLKKDFYKNTTSMGWIYLDYRNSKDKLDKNNIIYGHSMKNGTMFGTLKKALSSTWRKESNNMIINYDTEYGSFKFKIFSVYKVDYTTDYLQVDFNGEKEFIDFVNMLKNRSVFKSNEEIEYDDVILTLSTCTGSNNQRLVVHGVLMKVGE